MVRLLLLSAGISQIYDPLSTILTRSYNACLLSSTEPVLTTCPLTTSFFSTISNGSDKPGIVVLVGREVEVEDFARDDEESAASGDDVEKRLAEGSKVDVGSLGSGRIGMCGIEERCEAVADGVGKPVSGSGST
jgi:hypothetical protein